MPEGTSRRYEDSEIEEFMDISLSEADDSKKCRGMMSQLRGEAEDFEQLRLDYTELRVAARKAHTLLVACRTNSPHTNCKVSGMYEEDQNHTIEILGKALETGDLSPPCHPSDSLRDELEDENKRLSTLKEDELRARITQLEEGIKGLCKYGVLCPVDFDWYGKKITVHEVTEEGCLICDIKKLLKS